MSILEYVRTRDVNRPPRRFILEAGHSYAGFNGLEGYDVFVIELTVDDAVTLINRINLLHTIRENEPDLFEMIYHDSRGEFFPVEAGEFDDIMVPDRNSEASRTDCDRIRVGTDGVRWKAFIPGDDEILLDTEEISARTLRLMLAPFEEGDLIPHDRLNQVFGWLSLDPEPYVIEFEPVGNDHHRIVELRAVNRFEVACYLCHTADGLPKRPVPISSLEVSFGIRYVHRSECPLKEADA